MKLFSVIISAITVLLIAGCNSYQGDFVQKSEKELEQMESINQTAHNSFVAENYATAEKLLRGLTRERTVSRPLYQLELLSVLLMSGKHDKAHKLMMEIYQDLEMLFDTQLEDKAQSIWHGEINKVFKGDSYERSTFYAFMALSFIRQGNYEDALRCVKNGLLADADSNSENAVEDYAMLYFIGYLAALKMDSQQDAQEYLNWMIKSLAYRRTITEEEQTLLKDKFTTDFQKQKPNVIMVVWAGLPPTVTCLGDYKENRTVIHGDAVFDMLGISVENYAPYFQSGTLGDLDYQATTRGGRLMDNVLADQAAAKKAMKISGNLLFVIGSGCFAVSSRLPEPTLQLCFLGAGAGCYILGFGTHVIGYFMNPAADGRFWRNLPGQFFLIPMYLEPGDYNIMCAGYKKSDRTGVLLDRINVPDGNQVSVIHLPMMNQGFDKYAISTKFSDEQRYVISRANNNRMEKELK